MARIVSVWLERWPIARFLRTQGRSADARDIDPDQPFALSVEAAGGPRVAAVNEAGAVAGVAAGDRLADARAKAGRLQVRPMDPAADRAALERLGLWASRYTPVVAPWDGASGADGLFLDVTGATHLWGGEAGLVADLRRRLEGFGLSARVVLAGTAGAGWALARFGDRAMLVLEAGEEARALALLSVEGLRIRPETSAALRRLGLKRIGDLYGQPRAPLAARFGQGLLARLDGALGDAPEPLVPMPPPPSYEARQNFPSPVHTQETVVAVAGELMQELVPDLGRAGVGARALRLCLSRVDGEACLVDVGLAAPTRDPRHVERLVGLKLERLGGALDAAFGFETMRLEVLAAEP
jgi:protein ImuB